MARPRPDEHSLSNDRVRPDAAADGFTVGALAKRTGLTVRTLHHYDTIGLLTPAIRTKGDHRRYAAADVTRLQQIQSLRALGLSLRETVALMSSHGSATTVSPVLIVNAHRARLREKITAQTRVLAQLEEIALQLATARSPTVEQLCDVIRDVATLDRVRRHFRAEQLTTLATLPRRLTDAERDAVLHEWGELIPALERARARGDAPDLPLILALAQRWHALVELLTGGDRELGALVRRMYEEDGEALRSSMPHVPSRELFAYLTEAFIFLRRGSSVLGQDEDEKTHES